MHRAYLLSRAGGAGMTAAGTTGGVLVCGVNWLGDAVMSLPALQVLRAQRPGLRLTVLVKPALAPLWRLAGVVDTVSLLAPGTGGTFAAARAAGRARFDQALVFPNSFRSALIPYLARVPNRVGLPGQWRTWMLTRAIAAPTVPERRHQAWEYVAVTGVEPPDGRLPGPRLTAPPPEAAAARARLGVFTGAAWAALIPGAARGPAKRWPAESFAAVGAALARETGARLLVLGTGGEAELCAAVARGVGPAALDLSGRTSLPEMVALLAGCRLAVTNDSGGMHLAAAAGTRVVAVFGVTDPAKTGPLGEGHTVIAPDGVNGSRDVARDSEAARRALATITPERVLDAARAAWAGTA